MISEELTMITKEKAFEEICRACTDRLNEIYSAGVPDFAEERLHREIDALEKSETVMQFAVYHAAAKAAERMSVPMISCNGTFIAYLLGYMGVNPLPAHYYCKECGRYECDNDYHQMGIDLPEKVCSCGSRMISMGIGEPLECVWGEKKQFEMQDITIKTSRVLLPFVKKALCDMFGSDRIIACGIKSRKKDGSPDLYWAMGGYAVLPEGVTAADLEDELCWLEDGEQCIEANYAYRNEYLRIPIAPLRLVDVLYECQNHSGIFAKDIPLSELAKFGYRSLINLGTVFESAAVIDAVKPQSKREICQTLSAVHNTVECVKKDADIASSIKEWFESDSFKKYPIAEREDFFLYVTENGVPSDIAVKAYSLFRRGRSSDERFTEILSEYSFENDFFENAVKYKYLFPHHYNAAMMYVYCLLAYYSKLDRKAYQSIVKKHFNSK